MLVLALMLFMLTAADAAPDSAASLPELQAGIAARQAAIAAHRDRSCSEAGVGAQLSLMTDLDQYLRRSLFALCPRFDAQCMKPVIPVGAKVDPGNLAILKQLLTRYSWEQLTACAPHAGRDAWLIAQHADRDPLFQRRILAEVERAFRHGKASGEDFALLYDRVAVGRHRPQLFGSQGRCIGTVWRADPVRQPQRLDARRREVGLGPEADYQILMNGACG